MKNFTITLIALSLIFSWVNFSSAEEVLPPTIITRAQWGADESIKSWDPDYPKSFDGTIDYKAEKIVIHHTASIQLPQDSDGTGQYKSKVRDIYKFHVFNAGWEEYPGSTQRGFGDIGYHYIIDPNGNIYQGRSGVNGVIGAHVYGFNKGTIGIALLGTYGATVSGNYVSQEITSKAMASLEKLVGWLAATNDINLEQKTEICGVNQKGDSVCKSVFGLVGHRDLGQTICPGDNLEKATVEIRDKGSDFAQIYKTYIYQEKSNGPVYSISNGVKESFKDAGAFSSQGGQYQKIVIVPKSQIDIFSKKAATRYADWSLIREFNSNDVYLILDNKKRKLEMTEEEFRKLGFNPSDIKGVSTDEFNLYENGLKVKFGKNGDLLTSDGVKIYLVENGIKRYITSHLLFSVLGLKVSDVKKVSADEVSFLLDGEAKKYPDGTLVKVKGSDAVYLVDFGKKRKFWTLVQFLSLGYKSEKVIEIESAELANLAEGPAMKWPSGTLLKANDYPDVYIIINGEKNLIKSADEFLRKGYKWSDIISVSKEELAVYSLPSTEIQSGNLVRSENKPEIYLVDGSNLYWIKTAQDFENRGYKWSDVKIVSSQKIAKYVVLTPEIYSSYQVASSSTSTPTPSSTPVPEQKIGEQPKIRIAIFSPPSGYRIKVKANKPYDVYLDGKLLVSKAADVQTTYLLDNDINMKFVAKSDGTIFEILSYEDRPSWKPEANYNKFRGGLEIRYSAKSKKIWVINELSLEDYLFGIAETVQGDPTEFLKAMITSSRSYAFFHIQNGGKYGKDEIFHLKNTSSDQVYKGYGREEFASDIVKAATETRGNIAYFKDVPIRGLYSSGAAVKTKDACTVFGGEFCQSRYDYLRGGAESPAGAVYKNTICDQVNHCVGLMADGARALAKSGKTWQEILKYYYSGIDIKKAY